MLTCALALAPVEYTRFHATATPVRARAPRIAPAPPPSAELVGQCARCRDGSGIFATHKCASGCFFGSTPYAWSAAPDCRSVSLPAPCSPLRHSHLHPQPVCWDLAGLGDADPVAYLVVMWGYKYTTLSAHTELPSGGCHNRFDPENAAVPPSEFDPAPISPRIAFTAITPRSECQTWTLGNESQTVCARAGPPPKLHRCSKDHDNRIDIDPWPVAEDGQAPSHPPRVPGHPGPPTPTSEPDDAQGDEMMRKYRCASISHEYMCSLDVNCEWCESGVCAAREHCPPVDRALASPGTCLLINTESECVSHNSCEWSEQISACFPAAV